MRNMKNYKQKCVQINSDAITRMFTAEAKCVHANNPLTSV